MKKHTVGTHQAAGDNSEAGSAGAWRLSPDQLQKTIFMGVCVFCYMGTLASLQADARKAKVGQGCLLEWKDIWELRSHGFGSRFKKNKCSCLGHLL